MNKIITIVSYVLLIVLVVLLAASSASLFLKKQKVDTMLSFLDSPVFMPISVSGQVVRVSGRTVTIKLPDKLLNVNIGNTQGAPVPPKVNVNVPIVVKDNAKIIFFDPQNTSMSSSKEIAIGDIKTGDFFHAQIKISSSGDLETSALNIAPNNSSK